jgi:hypothetical protein
MEIKDFIKTTLTQLSEALKETSSDLGKNIKLTNTVLRTAGHGNYGLIEFDLAVEAKDVNTAGGKAGIKIAVVEANLGKDSELTSSSISRIRFKVEADF